MTFELHYWHGQGRPEITVDRIQGALEPLVGTATVTSTAQTVCVTNPFTGTHYEIEVGKPGPSKSASPGFACTGVTFRIPTDVPLYFALEALPVAVGLQEALDLLVENPRIISGGPALIKARTELMTSVFAEVNEAAVRLRQSKGGPRVPTVPTEDLVDAWRHNRDRAAWEGGWEGATVRAVFALRDTQRQACHLAAEWCWGDPLVLPRMVTRVLVTRPDEPRGKWPEVAVIRADDVLVGLGRFNRPTPVAGCDGFGPPDDRALDRLEKVAHTRHDSWERLPLEDVRDSEGDDESGTADERPRPWRDRRASVITPAGARVVKAGVALTKEGLFELIADEVFKDGVVEAWENQLLQAVMHRLEIEPAVAIHLATHAKFRFNSGQLSGTGALEPLELYQKLLAFVYSDGKVDTAEAQMLTSMRQILSIPEPTHQILVEKVLAQSLSQSTSPAGSRPVRTVLVPADLYVLASFTPGSDGGRRWAMELDATGRLAVYGPHRRPLWGRSSAILTRPLRRAQLVDLVETLNRTHFLTPRTSPPDEPDGGGRGGSGGTAPGFKIAEGSGGPESTPGIEGRTPAGPDEAPTTAIDGAPGRHLVIRHAGHTHAHTLPAVDAPVPDGAPDPLDVWRLLAVLFRLSMEQTTAELAAAPEWDAESRRLWPREGDRELRLAEAAGRYRVPDSTTSTPAVQALYVNVDHPEHHRWLTEVDQALTLYGAGETFNSRGLFARALKIAQDMGCDDHRIPYSLDAVAALQCQLGRPEEAVPLLRQAVAACEKAFGPVHFTVAQELDHLGLVFEQLGKSIDVSAVRNRADEIWENWGGRP